MPPSSAHAAAPFLCLDSLGLLLMSLLSLKGGEVDNAEAEAPSCGCCVSCFVGAHFMSCSAEDTARLNWGSPSAFGAGDELAISDDISDALPACMAFTSTRLSLF